MKVRSAKVQKLLPHLIEDLAAIEHDRWAHWQRYVHGKGTRLPDGSLILPAEVVRRWDEQIAKKYAELTQEEKESDRDQVRRYLPTVIAALTDHTTT
jgi:hypothetical protein